MKGNTESLCVLSNDKTTNEQQAETKVTGGSGRKLI
jgi:hypothetical protein